MNLLPAILVGGPPHSGKSVLTYSLSQLLRERNSPHYLFRAAPDGEGDWAQQLPPQFLSDIRFKGEWSADWVGIVCRDIAARTLPLLVDMGGKPRDEQFAIFDQCTGAIIVTPLEDDAAHSQWHAWVQAHGLPVLADLRSSLTAPNALATSAPILSGTISNLERGSEAQGPVLTALNHLLVQQFQFPGDEIRNRNLSQAPSDALLIDLDQLAARLFGDNPRHLFKDTAPDIERTLNHIPTDVPLALYGRMPSWLAALLGARRQVRYLFDVRLGWISLPNFVIADLYNIQNEWVNFTWEANDLGWLLKIASGDYYLDYYAMRQMTVPAPPDPATQRISFFGKLPMWMFVALGCAYRDMPTVWAEQAHRLGLA